MHESEIVGFDLAQTCIEHSMRTPDLNFLNLKD